MNERDTHMLEVVKTLASELENGNRQGAEFLLDELTQIRQSELFYDLGKVTRKLHGALNNFEVEACMSEVAGEVIPDAMARLDFVVSKTEEAAQRTLAAVEAAVPICDAIGHRAVALRAKWTSAPDGEMPAEECRALVEDARPFFDQLVRNSGEINGHLTDVLIAQQYQDITGQIMEQVAAKVQEVQEQLVRLIRVRGPRETVAVDDSSGKDIAVAGPRSCSDEDARFVDGQDEVDELLSSLGF